MTDNDKKVLEKIKEIHKNEGIDILKEVLDFLIEKNRKITIKEMENELQARISHISKKYIEEYVQENINTGYLKIDSDKELYDDTEVFLNQSKKPKK